LGTSGDKIQTLEIRSSLYRKRVQRASGYFNLFILVFILLTGFTVSGFNAFAQTNETNSLPEARVETLPDASTEEAEENIDQEIPADISTNTTSNDDIQNVPNDKNQVSEPSSVSNPDGDCLFDPSLPKCTPDENGKCPEGFAMNGDGQCFPRHDRCPGGYHSHEDDESGRCIPDNVPCDPGYIMNPDYPSCDNIDRVCQNHPDLEACKQDDNGANNIPYKSGYNHGCPDAKITDSSKRYINQPGKGPGYHTNEFMRGYNDGFESCSMSDNPSPSPPSTLKGIFKVIVEVANNSPIDISGGISVNVDHSPENIVKSAHGIYFPAGEIVSKTFAFKSSGVPVGTEFEVNIDYGDDYNQYQFGANSPEKRPETINFKIS